MSPPSYRRKGPSIVHAKSKQIRGKEISGICTIRPMNVPPDDATRQLHRLRGGDRAAAASLMPLVYEELRQQAARYLNHERCDHVLQPTALVHEAFLKLVDQTRADWNDHAHFAAVASQAMRRVLVDHARAHGAAKRGSGRRITIETMSDFADTAGVGLTELDEALSRLSELSERQAQVVELRFFGGLGVPEVAVVLDVSERTVKGDWRIARAWLQEALAENHS